MKNITTIIVSLVVSVLILTISRINPDPTLEGLTGRLWLLPVYFVVVPIIFGIVGFLSNKENRFKKALISFGFSFITALVILIPFALTNKWGQPPFNSV